eukprot:TRINITY_DN1508_c0_g1_i10.p1 TRINITY_DN1508_c0_g1~~TRINITY_DN1508_c0_g1_i10.p1  ORF type:complete len:562 (+),score=69.10 TRINITY_DN1508_c0_g1_i10:2545-4230(+)
MVMQVNESNISQVLMELKEYAQEVDVDFVRQAVRAVGRCAIKLQAASEKCVEVLLALISSGVNYVVQEAVVVLKDIFRRYPQQYESILSQVCSGLEALDEPQAKAAMVWILGEYADRIADVEELLEGFLDNFPAEPHAIQLQLLSSTVKMFLKKLDSPKARELLSLVLTSATENSDDPDLRDRAFIYWRLLSSDPSMAKSIVLQTKPTIKANGQSTKVDPQILRDIATLSSVYHKRAEAFVSRVRMAVYKVEELDQQAFEEEVMGNVEQEDDIRSAEQPPPPQMDLLDLGMDELVGTSLPNKTIDVPDLLSGFDLAPQNDIQTTTSQLPELLRHTSGLIVYGQLKVVDQMPTFQIQLMNTSMYALSSFKIQFNVNVLGLIPSDTTLPLGNLAPNSTSDVLNVKLQLDSNKAQIPPQPQSATGIQIALSAGDLGVLYFVDQIRIGEFANALGAVESSFFIENWRQLGDGYSEQISINPSLQVQEVISKLTEAKVYLVAQRPVPNVVNSHALYLSCQLVLQGWSTIFLELKLAEQSTSAQLAVKSQRIGMGPLFKQLISSLLG